MNCLSKLLCSAAHVLLFFCKEKFWVFAHVGKSLAKYSQRFSEKKKRRYLWFYLTQIVHSNDKILFLSPMNCFYGAMLMLSFFSFKEKFCVSAHVSKLLSWTMYTLCQKSYLSNAFPPWRHCWSISPWF